MIAADTAGAAAGGVAAAPALELRRVAKRFGGVAANDGVTFTVAAGTIHALVGENGAGKTTAMRIAFGWLAPDAGEVLIDGRVRRFGGPQDAIRCGVGMVHQHFLLADAMTVTENVVLGAEPGSPWALDLGGAAARVAALARDFHLAVDPGALVASLSVGERQRVELLKALYRRARLLILDEPTAVLAPAEVAALFAILRRLRAEGHTVVLITHKLAEVLAIADQVTVMRAGRVVSSGPVAATGAAELARQMIGQVLPPPPPRRPRCEAVAVAAGVDGAPRGKSHDLSYPKPRGVEPRLVVRDLAVMAHDGRLALEGVSFEVQAGEIVGVAGVEGNGQAELIDALAGLAAAAARVTGVIALDGRDVTHATVRRRRDLGLAHVPADRQRRGLLLDFDLAESSLLGARWQAPLARGPWRAWLDRAAIGRRAAGIVERFAVTPARLDLPARALSGGNQQKLVVGRELSPPPRLLLAAQPTRGVDVAGAALIHRCLAELRDAGGAILLVSSDLDELMALADRILVLFRGRLAGELDPAQATTEEIGRLMTGGGRSAPAQPGDDEPPPRNAEGGVSAAWRVPAMAAPAPSGRAGSRKGGA
jgi:ABC-type uncharacterized transport system ATPase subunit